MFDIALFNKLFISSNNLFIFLIELTNSHEKHPLKEHRYKFKTD